MSETFILRRVASTNFAVIAKFLLVVKKEGRLQVPNSPPSPLHILHLLFLLSSSASHKLAQKTRRSNSDSLSLKINEFALPFCSFLKRQGQLPYLLSCRLYENFEGGFHHHLFLKNMAAMECRRERGEDAQKCKTRRKEGKDIKSKICSVAEDVALQNATRRREIT